MKILALALLITASCADPIDQSRASTQELCTTEDEDAGNCPTMATRYADRAYPGYNQVDNSAGCVDIGGCYPGPCRRCWVSVETPACTIVVECLSMAGGHLYQLLQAVGDS